jgi:polysaccharide biosynthesis/export protein
MRHGSGDNDGHKDQPAQETLSFAELLGRRDPRPGYDCAVLMLGGSGDERVFPLTRNPTVIGRSNNADLVLPDPDISDFHARIIKHTFGYTVEDLQSAEGTFLQDRRVNHARLVDGDVLRLGKTLVTFMGDQTNARKGVPKAQTLALVPTRATARGMAPHEAVMRVQYSPAGAERDAAMQASRDQIPAKAEAGAEEAEASIEDILRKVILAARYVRRHAVLISIFAAAGLGLAAASFKVLPPVRAATCMVTLYPAPKVNPIDPQAHPRSPQSDAMTFFVGVERAFAGSDNILKTLKRMGVPFPSDADADRISKRLRFDNMGNNTYAATLTPKVFDRRDDWYVRFLDAHVKNYFENEVEKTLKVFVAEVEFLRSQTEEADKKVKETTQEAVKYREAHAEQLLAQNALGTSPAELETRRIELSGQISRLSGELDGIRSQLARGSALSQARTQMGQSDREALAALNRKLTELRAQGFGDRHPDVERILNERSALQKAIDEHLRAEVTQFEKRSNTAYDGLQSQADQLQAQLRAARSELSFIESNRRSLRVVSAESPKVNAKLDELLRAKEDATRQHGVLFDRLRKAEVQLELERVAASSRYEIVSPVRLEWPPGRKAFGARLALGIGIGILLAALVLGIGELRRLFARIARETPATMVVALLLGSVLSSCGHGGRYVWVQDLPANRQGGEAIIHPRDTLLVEVQKQPSLSGEFAVREDGHYVQPMAGSILVADRTPSEVADAVAAALRDVVVSPVVSVWISRTTPIRVSVVGEVKTPGSYELTRHRSILSVLALAGWLSDFAHADRIFVVRVGSSERIRFRLSDITTAEPRTAKFELADADVVVVE